ncbi:START domain-containing proteins involved in steroidogenesis/phosphatidylcholine transfer [Handroanthus impetiginosus]|uniref:START domain-containing proteins involved in steroidogenesis/phosphatidylcholine transfer n=1 Tax=Handroanthus impetiginosus TaxID=429701 RepID=A0A2G9I293_9LAMI|nr:START domain-containing proteins involved in steroidogenesis/phosphatidylcholine transfer [Handroanthus impetiginosus]
MTMSQEEFWRENKRLGTDGWTWTLAVILLILTCRLLRYRLRFFCRGTSLLSSASSTTPKTDAIPSIRSPGIVSDLDLKNLINNLNENCPDDNIWEHVIDKRTNFIAYKAKCCKPQDGPLKYLSVTTFEDCSVEVLVKFYMDNHYRMQWDKTVVHHQQLEVDRGSGIEIGRTIKKFPFLTPREYVLAWRLWQGMDGSFYCFSKECDHPLAPKQKKYIRVAVFRSGWRIRQVPGRNACEIRMVHQEDAGLNLEMAKLAFAKGIWSYVRKMDYALRKYCAGKQHQLNSTAGASMHIQKVRMYFLRVGIHGGIKRVT